MPVHLLRYFLRQDVIPAGGRKVLPPEDLRAVVDGYWYFNAEEALCGSLIFSDGIPALIFYLDAQQQIVQGWCSAQLMQNIHMNPPQHAVLIVRFTPTGFYRIAPDKIASLRHRAVWSIAAIFRDEVPVLPDLSAFLRKRIQPVYIPPLLESALQMIREAKGAITIHDLASRLGINYKWLERQCTTVTGIGPKEHARLQRFLHAYFHMMATHGKDLMGTAVHHGYYDQNHFTREFRRFTGLSPKAYHLQLARSLRNVS